MSEESDQEFEFDQHDESGDEGFEAGEGFEDAEGDFVEADGEVEQAQERSKTLEEIEKQKAARLEQKQKALERKMAKPNSEMIMEAKKIWEQLRQKRLTKPERKELMDQMMKLVSGKALDIIFKHDASRIVQCCVKYGSPAQRDSVAEELSGQYARLSTSKYGRFIVSKILQYCSPKYRNAVIADFYGKVRKLIRHKEASIVLDEAYSQYANSAQRIALMEEFYGPEFAVFKSTDATASSHTLEELLKSQPLKKQYILKYLRTAIDSVLEKSSFNVGKTPILHRAILDYVTHADASVAKDLIELLKDHLVHMLHTREGARVTQYCILHAGPKDRKQIIKSFKGFVHSIAKEQYGHSVLISLFECVDDTVILSKSIIGELFNPTSPEHLVNELLRDQYGSRVFLYLLCGRNRKYQPSYLINELEETDETRKVTSKKEDSLRKEQLLDAVSPDLIAKVALYANELLHDRNGATLLLETCQKAKGDINSILDTVVDFVEKSANGDLVHEAVEETQDEVVNVVKKMKAEKDAERKLDQGIDLSEPILVSRSATFAIKFLISAKESPLEWKTSFAKRIWSVIKPNFKKLIAHCAKNPSNTSGLAFIFIALFESNIPEISSQLKKEYKELKVKIAKSDQPQKKGKKRTREASKSGIEILDELLQ
ncbi:hypothetical protein HK103_006602 [Boothiomyces macroporosus]|uniref:PUM-HD domain-containing protein n=1 Tax=Boothiomyces macroporosus TaxID=261099 RepID=A0AAD5UDM6_9FUNG|nr:hypothetical protein HK103_006602 [Boothiomyces macroporosus]